jgi:hypothetical protein
LNKRSSNPIPSSAISPQPKRLRATTDSSESRVTLPETEYLRAVAEAERRWITAVLDDLRSGALSWSHEELTEALTRFL